MKVYYKMRQMLLQNATNILLQKATEIYYKMDQVFYYKMQQFYHKMQQLLQNATFITNCNNTQVFTSTFVLLSVKRECILADSHRFHEEPILI